MAQAQKITPRAKDFSEWYNDVVMQAELADYSPCAAAWSSGPMATACGS